MRPSRQTRTSSRKIDGVAQSGSKPILGDVRDEPGSRRRSWRSAFSNCAKKGVSWASMAVLYRSHFHALEFQLELTRQNIPFSITSGIRFFEQAHIKDIAAYVKFVINPRDELALQTDGSPVARASGQMAQTESGTRFSAVAGTACWPSHCRKFPRSFPKNPQWTGRNSPRPSRNWKPPDMRSSPAKMIQLILEAGYEDHLQEEYANYRARQEDIEQLAAFSRQFNQWRNS